MASTWKHPAHEDHEEPVESALQGHHPIPLQVRKVDLAALGNQLRTLVLQQPAHMREEHASSHGVRIDEGI